MYLVMMKHIQLVQASSKNMKNIYCAVLKKYCLLGSLFTVTVLLLWPDVGRTMEFDKNTSVYTEAVEPATGASSSEVQLGGEHTYDFKLGGHLGRTWILNDPTDITLNVGLGYTLAIGGNGENSDGLEVSEGSNLTIHGGNLSVTTDSSNTGDASISIRDNGHFTASVENFTTQSGTESAFKIMSEWPGRGVNVDIDVENEFISRSGGTGLAVEASSGGGSADVDISARNIDISTIKDDTMPRLGGVYMMAYYSNSQKIGIALTAAERLSISGGKYGIAGWGDINAVFKGKDISITSDLSGSKGLYINSHTYKNGAQSTYIIGDNTTQSVTIEGKNSTVAMYNKSSLSITSNAINMTAKENGSNAVYMNSNKSENTTTLELHGKELVNISGENSAVAAYGNSHVTVDASNIVLTGNSYAILANAYYGNTAASFTARAVSLQVQSGEEGYAAYVKAHSSVDLQADELFFNAGQNPDNWAAYVSGEQAGLLLNDGKYAKVTAAGYMGVEQGGSIRFFMGKGSVYTGGAYADENSELGIYLKGKAMWNLAEDSTVSHLHFENGEGSGVNMRYRFSMDGLHIRELSGDGGVFYVNTDIEADQTDQIVVETGTGVHKLDVAPSGAEPSREAMDSFIVQRKQGDASFSLANEKGVVEHGLYFHTLAERNNKAGEKEWYLRRATTASAPETPTGETEAAFSGFAGHYALWYSQLTDLRKRLGDVRYGTQTGLWVRGFADKSDLDGLAGTRFTQHLLGGSLGYDTPLFIEDPAVWLVGMQIRSARADQRVNGGWGGHGDLTSLGGSLYSTWLHSDGWYVDAVATVDWYKHDIRATMLDDTPVHDDRSAYGLGASLEAGRKMDFAFSNERRDYWFLEPQFQLSWFWVKGGDFSASNGMKIEQKDMDALTGRAGLVLGKRFVLEGGDGSRYIQPYVKAGVNHEFLGEQEAHINGIRMTSELEDTRGYYGAGVDWQATDNLRLYMQAEREHGEHFTREYNISVGLKWSF